MKNLQRNKGFTLVELIVSIAILAFIIVAVGGIMASNNVIYKKEKADLTVQGSAQDIYNRINEDIMQAKHVYIEGYVSDGKIDFLTNKVASTSQGVTLKKYLLPTDNYILNNSSGDVTATLQGNMERSLTSREEMLAAMTAADRAFYEDLLNTPESDIETKLNTCTTAQVDVYRSLKFYTAAEVDTIKKSMTDEEKAKYTTYYNRVRYFDDEQISEEATFLNSIPTKSNNAFEDLMKYESDGSLTYKYLYMTKLVLVYSQKVDTSSCSASTLSKYNAEVAAGNKPKDEVTVTYTFGGTGHEKEITCEYSYKYMTELNTSSFSGTDNNIITNQLNYATDSSGNAIPGCEAQIDASKDSIKLYLYFQDNSMTYTDKGMVTLRNSYVLHDAK